MRGRRLHPSTRFHVLTGSGCSLLALLFSGSCYLALSSYVCFAYASFIWVHLIALRGEALRPPPCTPHPLLFFNRLLWLPTLTLFFWFILSLLVSIETCAYVLLSWYALRGEALRPPPCTPHPLLCFNRLLLLPTLTSFLHMHRLFGFILSHCGGRRLHPPTRFDVLIGSGCSLLSLFFSGSCYLY